MQKLISFISNFDIMRTYGGDVMGRISGGGGGHSSGGFGGGHSSGGFSGGGRSSGSFGGGHSSNSGYRSSYRSGYHRTYYYGGGPRPPRGPYRRTPLISYVLSAIIILVVVVFMFRPATKPQQNTTKREPLSGVVSKSDWYMDDLGWVQSKKVMIEGLEDFYNETGIQPYVAFIPYDNEMWNGNDINANKADQYLEKLYADTFKDEGHFIFAYFACSNDSRSEMDGSFRYLSGYSADTIMDNEAISILWGNFEKNYRNTSLSMEKMISKTFTDTAKTIMSKPTNGWDFMKVAVIAICIIAVIVALVMVVKIKAKRAKEKEDFTKDILEKPLETFGDDTSDLEEKYKD